MSSSNTKPNNHKYKDDKQLHKWYNMAQPELKKKITDNLNKRVINSTQAINHAIRLLIQDTQSNHIWLALFPNTSIDKYKDIFPSFEISETLINNALHQLLQHVDNWAGVDINSMNKRPKDFAKYLKTADNWWNRYKAKWLGTHFFHPLLEKDLYEYIVSVTEKYTTQSYNPKVTNTERIESERNNARELLYFTASRKILYAEVRFTRTRKQPLILDQSFVKSEELQLFFHKLGQQHCINWMIPPYDKGKAKREHIRHYAREWCEKVVKDKQLIYDREVMRKEEDEVEKLTQPKKPPIPRQICNNNFNIPPSIEYDTKSISSTSAVASGSVIGDVTNNKPSDIQMINSGMKIHVNKYVFDENINNDKNYLHASGIIIDTNNISVPQYVNLNNQQQMQQGISFTYGNTQYIKTGYNDTMYMPSPISMPSPMSTNMYGSVRGSQQYMNNKYYDDDTHSGTTHSTISLSNYNKKSYPYRRRGISYRANMPNIRANMNMPTHTYRPHYMPTNAYRPHYMPVAMPHQMGEQTYYNTNHRICKSRGSNYVIDLTGTNDMDIHNTTISVPSPIKINDRNDRNDRNNNYYNNGSPIINNDLPHSKLPNNISCSSASTITGESRDVLIEDNYSIFDQGNDMNEFNAWNVDDDNNIIFV